MRQASSPWRPPSNEGAISVAALAALEDRLRLCRERHAHVALASSLQAEDMVLLDASVRLGFSLTPFVLDTKRLHDETLSYLDAVEHRYGLSFLRVEPDPEALSAYETQKGRHAFYESSEERVRCCALRKVAPLAGLLKGFDAWVTGQRREQSVTRVDLPFEENDLQHGIRKFNPLADWSEADVWRYIRQWDVPVHPLYSRGYASIGCEPCTRAIRAGENLRAGRWWWEDASGKECGLHIGKPAQVA
jgi:phosphoadenosine phosphosulfate reductase